MHYKNTPYGIEESYFGLQGGAVQNYQMYLKCSKEVIYYRISSVIRQSFFLPKQSQKSRSILQDRSRSLGLFRKGKTRIIAKFHRADLVICSHSRERETPSYNRINKVYRMLNMSLKKQSAFNETYM